MKIFDLLAAIIISLVLWFSFPVLVGFFAGIFWWGLNQGWILANAITQ